MRRDLVHGLIGVALVAIVWVVLARKSAANQAQAAAALSSIPTDYQGGPGTQVGAPMPAPLQASLPSSYNPSSSTVGNFQQMMNQLSAMNPPVGSSKVVGNA